MCIRSSSVQLIGIEVLLQIDPKLFTQRFEIPQVLVVLSFILDFGLDAWSSRVST